VAQSWKDLPLDRPVAVEGVGAEAFALMIESLPADAPAVVAYNGNPQSRPAEFVAGLLVELDRVARQMFPAWLPEATHIHDTAGAGVVAVRSIALRAARDTGQYGPFLADLAERSIAHRPSSHGPFDPEIRAVGLAKVISRAFGRSRIAILICVGHDLTADQQRALAIGARWLSDVGHFGVWFTGAPMRAVDTLETVPFTPAEITSDIEDSTPTEEALTYPAIAGRPHPASVAEQSLEAALENASWAAGREWNKTYQAHPLINPVKLDLVWHDEQCVVEIDGPEHREPARFAADRQRDVLLQLAGFAVLRFTNHQVMTQIDLVLAQIQQFLAGRRAGTDEGTIDVGPEAITAEAVTAAAGAAAHPDGRER
jgi:very-short-patch-repair endonuclease